MDRFQDILFVEDHLWGHGRSFSCALELARVFQARLTVVGMAGGSEDPSNGLPLTPGAAARRDARLQRWERHLADQATWPAVGNVPIRTRVLEGDRPRAVLAELRRGRYDLVVKAADGHVPLWPWRLSPTDRRLFREAPCPVWMLDPSQRPGLGSVLAAVDVARGSAGELNRRIVGLAAALAARAGSDLHLLHAWGIPGETILSSPLRGLTATRMRHLLAQTRRERRRDLEALLADEAPGRGATLALRKGDPVRAIRQEACHVEADVVVVGHSGRHGLDALLLGNIPERLVGRVPGAVLSLGAGRAVSERVGSASLQPEAAGPRARPAENPRARAVGS